ncbi:glutathione S-transferase-like [Silene latifolia]|uniref:glutathione S-transferase-like n=1 Tax=Silene latifolia TaxID=37657 RepID=UPI003D783654
MAIKVYGYPTSTAVLRVVAALNEKQLDFEFVPVDMRAGAHKQQPFISLNPFGQVPALEDGDITLFESRAITKYIAYTYETQGTPLVHRDDKKQMAAESVWQEVEAHHFDPVGSKLGWELVYKVMLFGMETDMAVVEENEAKLVMVLDIYEARLAESKYLGGDSFSLADLHHLPLLNYLMETQVKKLFDERPHVSAWCKDILVRPAWEKTVAFYKHG